MAPQHAVKPRALVVNFDLGSCAFEDSAVLYAGGAGGFASPAAEAAVEVHDERILNGEASGVDLQYLVDASARGVGLASEDAIGGALV
jgi:hypothetical protein